MNHHRITVHNRSGTPCAYHLILSTSPSSDSSPDPNPTSLDSVEDSHAWHCVYQSSLLVPTPHGSTTFILPETFVAVCGSARSPIAEEGTLAFASDWHNVTLGGKTGEKKGSRVHMSMPPGEEASLKMYEKVEGEEEDGIEAEGAFAVSVDSSFELPHPATPFVGFGAANPYNTDEIIPMVVYEVQPGTTFVLKPVSRWSIVQGFAKSHTMVPMDGKPGGFVDVEFPSDSCTCADILHDAETKFTVKFLSA